MCDYDIIFDIYKNSLDIDDEEKIKHMPQLLGHFYNYLNSIILVYSDEISEKEIENRKTNLITNINIIIDFYNRIETRKKPTIFEINYLLIDLMSLAIIILYSYIYVINNIKKVNLKTRFIKKIIPGRKFYTIKELLQITEKETDIIAKDKFLKKMIIEILYIIIKIPKEKIEEFNISHLYDYFKVYIFLKANAISIDQDIDSIINKFKINIINYPDEIITITQYEGICWFTAFLTCICYSDANRKIFYDKVSPIAKGYIEEYISTNNIISIDNDYERELFILYKYNINNSTNISEKLFIIFVYIIIKYISIDKKKYTDYNEKNLNLIKLFIKDSPISILRKLYEVYIINPKSYNDSNYNYFKVLNKKNTEIYKSDNKFFAMHRDKYNFINIFYDILNIKTLFTIKYTNNYYIFNDKKIVEDPDIILIYRYTSAIYNTKITKYNIDELIKSYELDYILFLSDKNTPLKNKLTSFEGHVVCAITYNKDEYYYDSRNLIKIPDSDIFRNPCPLIKKEWKNKNIGGFCLKECFYSKFNEKSKISKIIKNSTDDMCYKYDDNYIMCYVKKQSELSGGTNEKLTSTNTKINIVIDNKKIQRTVYINNNGIKVIKYNNKLINIYNK